MGRFGDHWKDIGFQGKDPATDFRAAGLLQIFLILMCDGKKLREIFQKAQNLENQFPFCVVTINITVRIMKLIIRKPRKFYKLKRTVEDVFLQCLEEFIRTWESEDLDINTSKTALDSV